ncbi:MAG: hypothetical protein K2X93_07070 [Candidatus Obscuribacterales bacterium]|nr:hypothetical protein [Candidatus Obscuribacterales bacterium]
MISQVVSESTLERSGINLDIDLLKSKVEEVLSDELYWFPVRHHSPNVAFHLRRVIKERKPKVIFIEGPSQANELIKYLTDSKTRPPVALYSSFRDDANIFNLAGVITAANDIAPVFPAWYPFLQYSPEYVAMMLAAELGIKVEFIDLPHYARLKPFVEPGLCGHSHGDDDSDDEDDEDDEHDGAKTSSPDAATTQDPDPAKDEVKPKRDAMELGSEHLIIDSQFYQQLAQVGGYRSFDEAWDSLFEMRRFDDSEIFRKEIAEFCCAARMTSFPGRVQSDGTVERERFMKLAITRSLETMKISSTEAMVVCGGFHLFLDRADKVAPPEIPEGTVYNTIVPYSYFRVSQLAGYDAGTRAPQFYQRVWDMSIAKRHEDIAVEHVVAVLNEARAKGLILSSADAIAVSQHAEMLSRLRGRMMPVLDDLHDALVTCCCKGDPREEGATLFGAIDAADIGHSIGKVTTALGQLPIVNDFYTQMDALGLNESLGKEKRLTVEIDKREELGERRSVFLHRLRFLDVPLCAMADAPTGDFSSGKIFREKWQLKWSPGVEASLIDLNLYGDSIETCSLSRLRERLKADEHSAALTSQHLIRAVDMDLPDLIRSTEEALSAAVDGDNRFVSLTQALNNLLLLDKYLVYRSLRRGQMDELIVRCFDRACFSIADVIAVPESEQEGVVTALIALAEATQHGDKHNLDRDLFAEHVKQAAHNTVVPFLRGAFLGMLAELRELSPEDLAESVLSLSKAPADIMVTAGDLLDGIMAVSRTSIMLGADALIDAIDELLRASEWDPFLAMLPKMRGAFERLNLNHRDSLASRVAELYGLKESSSLTDLRISTTAAVVVARIDQQVDAIMKEWEL